MHKIVIITAAIIILFITGFIGNSNHKKTFNTGKLPVAHAITHETKGTHSSNRSDTEDGPLSNSTIMILATGIVAMVILRRQLP